MRIRTQITLYFGPFVLGILTVFFILHYYLVRQALLENAQTELRKTEQNVHRSVQVLLSTAINSYLRSITEQNISFIELQYRQFSQGKISEEEAKNNVQSYFHLQTVGDSGYLVAVEEKEGKLFLDLHPYLPKKECSDTEGCQQWAKVRNGYTEYDWKNPSDNSYRKKAAFVQEFKPWKWVVGASSYRDEFVKLVDIDDLKKLIGPIRINKSGYFFVFDEENTLLIHPEFDTIDASNLVNSRGQNIIKLLKASKDGYLIYFWKNPSEPREREKYAFIERIEDFGWYLVASGYFEEVYAPVDYLKKITLFMVLFSGSILLILIMHLSKVITSPLLHLKKSVNQFYGDKGEIRWNEQNIEEVNILGRAFSAMSRELNKSLRDLKQTNVDLRLSREENEQSKLYYQSIVNSMPSGIIAIDPNFMITLCNRVSGLVGIDDSTEVIGKPFFSVFKEFEGLKGAIMDRLVIDESTVLDHVLDGPDGKQVSVEITVFPIPPFGKRGAVIRIDDVTERVEMEMRLRQSQKMDAVGQLAGGIAHDFNNMLSGIVGSAELLRHKVGSDDSKFVDTIIKASGRASELIQKLLAFSRKDSIAFSPLDLHAVVEDTVKILNHTLDKRIAIERDFAAENSVVEGDWSLLENMMLNIGINGGYAMKGGGELRFSTDNVTVTGEEVTKDLSDLLPGEYIRLKIEDTGCGIEEDSLKRIFEPFFTTKKQGEGTGLGLAAVYGAVKRHKGTVMVDSEVQRGTCFTIFLPLSREGVEKKIIPPRKVVQGDGCVLLIDDEQLVRNTARSILENLGYTVLEAENGREGIRVFQENRGKVDLVLLDMLMPVMDGSECFAQLQHLEPGVKVLMSSGFTRDVDLAGLKKAGLRGFIRKPYNIVELSEVISGIISDAAGQ